MQFSSSHLGGRPCLPANPPSKEKEKDAKRVRLHVPPGEASRLSERPLIGVPPHRAASRCIQSRPTSRRGAASRCIQCGPTSRRRTLIGITPHRGQRPAASKVDRQLVEERHLAASTDHNSQDRRFAQQRRLWCAPRSSARHGAVPGGGRRGAALRWVAARRDAGQRARRARKGPPGTGAGSGRDATTRRYLADLGGAQRAPNCPQPPRL